MLSDYEYENNYFKLLWANHILCNSCDGNIVLKDDFLYIIFTNWPNFL